MAKKTITRRQLLRDSTVAAIGTSLFMSAPVNLWGKNDVTKTKVVLIRDKEVLDASGKPFKRKLEQMLNKGLMELTGQSRESTAWKNVLNARDVLGIKTNVWRHLRTPKALEEILQEKAIAVGLAPENISINDRGILKDSVFQRSTALINVRPMRTHAWSGVGSLLKNYIMFVDRPWDYHPDSCADLATLWSLPHVRGKTRLNILVMLTPLFHGVGPHHFNKKFTWKYNGLLLGFDPVAVDSVGVRIIQAQRKKYFNEDKPLNPPAKHIFLADTRHHLGTANPEKIDLIILGWQSDSLI
ncbi:MAG: DUF362 domain-containing protein [Marinilabiliaceae bacterium]|nr:DUF362 domain-containing protein [Marinilabiliaceae bacterium]